MASEVDIANLALGHLGDDATVASFDPPEGSPQAEHCAHFYPVARDVMLEEHAWSFATTTATLTPLGTPPDGWAYSYAVPNLCLRPLLLYSEGNRHNLAAVEYELETLADGQAILLTDTADAILRYTRKLSDTARFSPLFTEALSWLLASMLAGPVLKGETGVKAGETAYKTYLMRMMLARSVDANRSRIRLESSAPWISGR